MSTFVIAKPKQLHQHDALWCNGSTSDSGSACEGSNPSKATGQIARSNLIGRAIYFAVKMKLPWWNMGAHSKKAVFMD